ncbi:MAG: DUF3108 domain-containing protein [Pseudomonadales bacterium]|nr:DUF3108 domain-containing protein [Pseudomonadales bacterium]
MNIKKQRHRVLASIIISLISLLLSTQGSCQQSSIQPFTATYDSVWYPLALKGSASRSLNVKNKHHSLFQFEGKIMGTTLQESTSLQWQGCSPIPRSFSRIKKHIFSKKMTVQQIFNWPAKLVSARHKDNKVTITITAPTFDPLSYQLALRCDLKQGKKHFEYSVIRKTKIKRYVFEVIGEENIVTRLGLLPTIKVARSSDAGSQKQTTLWFSKQHDFTLVKLEQKESDNNHYVFTIRELIVHQ